MLRFRQPALFCLGVHVSEWLVTICPACHAIIIHKLLAHRRWLPDSLLELWREQQHSVPLQLQIEIFHPESAAVRGKEEQGREEKAA